jgi:hypothetical protein
MLNLSKLENMSHLIVDFEDFRCMYWMNTKQVNNLVLSTSITNYMSDSIE